MKKFFLSILIFLSSCQVTSYWSDDVYYSLPITRETGYVDLHDRYLRMKSRDARWAQFDDDFWYWSAPRQTLIVPSWRYSIYDPYFIHNYYNTPFLPQVVWPYRSTWTGFYRSVWTTPFYYNWQNPYYNPYINTWVNPYVRPKNTNSFSSPRLTPTPRVFNLGQQSQTRTGYQTQSSPVRTFNNTNINSTRSTYVPQTRSSSAPVRTFSSPVIPQTRTNSAPVQSLPRPSTNAPVRKF